MSNYLYYVPRAVPCKCGAYEAYWHGPVGLREYCCDACWKSQARNWRERLDQVCVAAADAAVQAVLEDVEGLESDDVRAIKDAVRKCVGKRLFSKFIPKTHMDM
jgi:hypothetical protein